MQTNDAKQEYKDREVERDTIEKVWKPISDEAAVKETGMWILT